MHAVSFRLVPGMCFLILRYDIGRLVHRKFISRPYNRYTWRLEVNRKINDRSIINYYMPNVV